MSDSEYTHAGLIVAYDDMTGVATIIESDRFVSTKLTQIQINDSHAIYAPRQELSSEKRCKIVKEAFANLGKKYDYLQVFGLFLSLILRGKRYAFFNSSNKMICSELIDLSYYKAGVKRINPINLGNVTPAELIVVYELKDVRKGL